MYVDHPQALPVGSAPGGQFALHHPDLLFQRLQLRIQFSQLFEYLLVAGSEKRKGLSELFRFWQPGGEILGNLGFGKIDESV